MEEISKWIDQMQSASGIHILSALLKSKRFKVSEIEVLKARQKDFGPELAQAKQMGWPIRVVNQISQSGARQHGIVTHFNFQWGEVAQLKDMGAKRLLMLDRIQDPHNFGAILRSAAAFDIDAVIVPQRNSAPLNDIVHQTACGGSIWVPIIQVANLRQTASELKDQGFWFVATDEHASQSFSDLDCQLSLCLVMGSEGEGVKQSLKEACENSYCFITLMLVVYNKKHINNGGNFV